MEFAYIYNAFGTKVTLIEMMPNLLPVEDDEVSDAITVLIWRTNNAGIKCIVNAVFVDIFTR